MMYTLISILVTASAYKTGGFLGSVKDVMPPFLDGGLVSDSQFVGGLKNKITDFQNGKVSFDGQGLKDIASDIKGFIGLDESKSNEARQVFGLADPRQVFGMADDGSLSNEVKQVIGMASVKDVVGLGFKDIAAAVEDKFSLFQTKLYEKVDQLDNIKGLADAKDVMGLGLKEIKAEIQTKLSLFKTNLNEKVDELKDMKGFIGLEGSKSNEARQVIGMADDGSLSNAVKQVVGMASVKDVVGLGLKDIKKSIEDKLSLFQTKVFEKVDKVNDVKGLADVQQVIGMGFHDIKKEFENKLFQFQEKVHKKVNDLCSVQPLGLGLNDIGSKIEKSLNDLQLIIIEKFDILDGPKKFRSLEDIKFNIKDQLDDLESRVTMKFHPGEFLDVQSVLSDAYSFEAFKDRIEGKILEVKSMITDKFAVQDNGMLTGAFDEIQKVMKGKLPQLDGKIRELKSMLTDKFAVQDNGMLAGAFDEIQKVMKGKLPQLETKIDELKYMITGKLGEESAGFYLGEEIFSDIGEAMGKGDIEQFLVEMAKFKSNLQDEIKDSYFELLNRIVAFQAEKWAFIFQTDIFQFFQDKYLMLPESVLMLKDHLFIKQSEMLDNLEAGIIGFVDHANDKIVDLIAKKYEVVNQMCDATTGQIKSDFNCGRVVRAYRMKAESFNKNNYDALIATLELIFGGFRNPIMA